MRALIIGYGHAGSYHEKYYPSSVEIAGIVDSDPKKA
jgi:predicted dehydrogenase